ncbi:MAG: alpha/beta fold hydrolase [Clostridia bacterium]|nr:alpha/beta fold hydrolase [Clostridia bacterium]
MFFFTTPWGIALFVLIILAAVLISYLGCIALIAHIIYIMHLKRTSPEKWTRECSATDDECQMTMYSQGCAWAESFAHCKKDLHIVNEGLNLYGEFYDLGSDKAVITVSGRTEGLRYGYYFAKPYTDAGWSVFTMDQRAHGESDGKFNTLGFEEHKDLIAWTNYLRDNFGIKKIVYHGICIGSATSLYALVSENRSDIAAGMVAEGMYPNFSESFKNHMIEMNRPTFPCMDFVHMWMRLYTGHSMKKGPLNLIQQLDKPILMIHSREDKYSLPNRAEELYALCASKHKKIVWFEKGGHSRLRFTDTEKYDGAVRDFINGI